MIDDNMYDVDSYSEKELLDILDLFHPTDRELEAKILLYIDKYSNDLNIEMIKLHTFFTNIYKRFFYIEEEEEEEEEETIIEGYTGINNNDNIKKNADIIELDPKNNVQLVSSLTYAKGKLNPILKQTYQRIITIDSQYRDSKKSLSTQYTFNFTETLKDVVSLKLYAVQIPYTWYTISESYGSNFIYIKGNVPGINNGLHDISINIPPGNYSLTTISNVGSDTSKSISGAIQTAISLLPGIYTDVSFGSTNLSYDVNQCKATFTIDIQKHYNENAYYFYFPGELYSPASISKDGKSVFNVNRNNNLSCFLGFNYASYSTCSFNSARDLTNILDNTVSKFAFDASNNYINIIQYYTDSTNGYIPKVSTIYQTIKITFPISSTGYTQSTIYDIVNTTIMNDTRFVDSYVKLIPITEKDICGNTFDSYGDAYFQWQFKLNRFNGNNIPLYKTVLQVPTVETDGTNPIWIRKTGFSNCFFFDNSYNELNNLISETYVFSSNFGISGDIYYYLKCNDVSYNANGINDFSYNLQNNYTGYSLNGYLSEINNGFAKINKDLSGNNGGKPIFNVNTSNITVSSPSSQSVAYFNINDSKFHMSIDMNKYLSTENFRIDISNTFLSNVLLFDTYYLNTDISFSPNIIYDVSAISQASGSYSGQEYPLLMSIYPDGINSVNNGISSNISYKVYLPEGAFYQSITELQNGINNAFKTFSDVSFSFPLKDMTISITPFENNTKVKSILNINITKILTENDYTIYFYDNNFNDIDNSYNLSSWYKNLKLYDSSYNLNKYNYSSYSDIYGNEVVDSDSITLIDGSNNEFQLIPIEEGVIDTGTLSFVIPAGTYNRIKLFELINALFDNRPETYGTRISYITDANNLEYTKIRWNVNKIYTSQDYKLVFYDLYSFVSCFLGNSSIRNATWDTTLGWIMGFHELTEYNLTFFNLNSAYYYDISNSTVTNNKYSLKNMYMTDLNNNPYRTIINITGDTTVSVNLYNYFMVILDDYNSSHLNDGLVTITPKDNNLSLPYYANRAKYICDPVTKQVLNTGITDVASNNLTQNQIYSINQIINTQNTVKSYTNQGVYVSDIFGLVPIKTTGYSPGQVYVEYGGTLQAQDRTYFGPVNIHRMAISLLNDRGEVVDLNGANWSLQFVCEQIYQNNNDIKK
jgi:hypothetical protein